MLRVYFISQPTGCRAGNGADERGMAGQTTHANQSGPQGYCG
jgi:hypothetical protein